MKRELEEDSIDTRKESPLLISTNPYYFLWRNLEE